MLERKVPFSKKPRTLPYFGPVNFRHGLNADNAGTVQYLVQSVLNVFGEAVRPLVHPNSPGAFVVSDGVTVLSERGLPREMRAEYGDLPHVIKALQRRVVFEACHDELIQDPIEVQLGRFIVSKQTDTKRETMLVASLTPTSGQPLRAEHEAVTSAHHRLGIGQDFEWPMYQPHLTIAALRFPPEETGQVLARAEILTNELFATTIVLDPLREW